MSEEMVTETTDNAVTAPVESGNQDWREALPEDLRADPTLASINDTESRNREPFCCARCNTLLLYCSTNAVVI